MDQLPAGSHFRAAVLQDEELARCALDSPDEVSAPVLPLEGYGHVVRKLDDVIDVLGAVVAHVSQGQVDVKPVKRPQTAYEMLKKKRSEAKRDTLLGAVLGERY
ncbi:hypothetical protein ACEN2A_08420 [Corynebacterium auriscanis]|uniref:hypothetical protein n=1 Tax=Corynebacterium auriscanis TaxID=99807 RepID=UPI003CF4D402